MRKGIRISLIVALFIISFFSIYALIDLVSVFMRFNLVAFFQPQVIFFCLISFLTFCFSIPSILFNFKMLKPENKEELLVLIDDSNLENKTKISDGTLWKCNVIFAVLILVFNGYMVSICLLTPDKVREMFIILLVCSFLTLISSAVLIDSFKIKKNQIE
jgi:hypothetical protein